MKQLSKTQTAVFVIGGLLMVIGAAMGLLRMEAAVWTFAPGAVMYAAMQMLQRYDGPNVVIRRLRRIMVLSDVLLLVCAALMYLARYKPEWMSQIDYVQYIGNNWVVVLLIAAVMQLYTVHRINQELEKDAR
ncbi:MAG: hypothetical protein IJ527_03585 [Prevotella sp.]|nr:hypothetical protein [Prevotella sp.]